MALPATDAFTRADSTSSLGANWTAIVGTYGVNANRAYPNTSGNESALYWNADAFGNDQYAQATLTTLAGGAWAGVLVRGTAGTNYYAYYTDGGSGYFLKYAGGAYTEYVADSQAWSVNDVVRIEAEGTAIRVKRNGSVLHSTTDSGLTSGSAGVAGFGGYTVGSSLDNWEGGDLGAAAATSLILPRGARTPFAILAR